jgi:hypothetical protein
MLQTCRMTSGMAWSATYVIITCQCRNSVILPISLFLYCRLMCEFPVTTAWHTLGLRMEERPPTMEDRCEYIE